MIFYTWAAMVALSSSPCIWECLVLRVGAYTLTHTGVRGRVGEPRMRAIAWAGEWVGHARVGRDAPQPG